MRPHCLDAWRRTGRWVRPQPATSGDGLQVSANSRDISPVSGADASFPFPAGPWTGDQELAGNGPDRSLHPPRADCGPGSMGSDCYQAVDGRRSEGGPWPPTARPRSTSAASRAADEPCTVQPQCCRRAAQPLRKLYVSSRVAPAQLCSLPPQARSLTVAQDIAAYYKQGLTTYAAPLLLAELIVRGHPSWPAVERTFLNFAPVLADTVRARCVQQAPPCLCMESLLCAFAPSRHAFTASALAVPHDSPRRACSRLTSTPFK
jgi:hypothetical protein